MNRIVLNRLRDICPSHKLSDLDILEVEEDCHIAFEIIGYTPADFNKAFQKAWEQSDATDLSDFIYDVWRWDG